ncbi:branched-chain amino acid ABC transporter permease [Desulfovibrio litoralis]|nr:branched-chain amino acid ABC transporter permease [Desulfovibrio litoralis]
MSPTVFFQQLLNGLMLGSLYGLVAIGYTMVYGILRLINFAHGDIFMLGAYFVFFMGMPIVFPNEGMLWFFLLCSVITLIIWFFSRKRNMITTQSSPSLGSRSSKIYLFCVVLFLIAGFASYTLNMSILLPWALAVILAIIFASCCGVIVEKAAYKPLRNAPRISALISAIAVSFLIENLALVLFSGVPKPVYQPEWLVDSIKFSGFSILPISILIPCVSLSLAGLLLWIVYKTKPGLAMRAISKDIETTRLMGVKVNQIIALTFALGSALAAASGIMWALRYPQIHPFIGVLPGFKAFIAAVFGGIGSIQGAIVGGLFLGFVEIMTVAFFPSLSGYRDAFAFVLLIVILLIKPTGLMGEKIEDKI